MQYNVERLTTIDLGRQGENLARTVEIDVQSMLERWPDAQIILVCLRPNEDVPYIADAQLRDGVLIWPITAADTAISGHGKIEIRAMLGDVVAKSKKCSTYVIAALTDEAPEPPEAAQGWVDRVIAAGAEIGETARQATETMRDAEDHAREYIDDLRDSIERGDYRGENGITPHIGENGNWWIGDTDTGVQARGEDGAPGADGQPGRDGYTPVKGVDYFDGAKGDPGQDGAPGAQGIQGERGYSGLVPKVVVPYSSAIEIAANTMTEIGVLTGAVTITLGSAVNGYDNEWDFVIRQGATAQTVTLPTVSWGMGIAPVFAADSVTVVRLYFIGSTLRGEWCV